jgi:hypothetical protein
MNLTAIRYLVETFNDHQLQQAEADLLESISPALAVPGADPGEQLTHIIGALWVIQHMTATD